MYVAPITAARSPASPAARLAAGLPVVVVSVLIMAAWLTLAAIVSLPILAVRASVRGVRALLQAVDYAGQVALGR